VVLLSVLTGTGCATLPGVQDRYLVCPYETVWDVAAETMKDRPVKVRDKTQGLIETDWIELEGAPREYGMFAREGFGSKERVRMTLLIKQIDDVTSISLSENREVWHRKGGVTSQATKWWPVEPSEESMTAVLNRMNAKLKERGCHPA
jgi:uncharacterized lipoprotein